MTSCAEKWMQIGRIPHLEEAVREDSARVALVPYHLRNFVLCINSHP